MNENLAKLLDFDKIFDFYSTSEGYDIEREDYDDITGQHTNGNNLQSDNPYNRLLPYDITTERYQHLSRIKANIAKAIQFDQCTLSGWLDEFQQYHELYGLAFTKEDHLYFINLFYQLLVTTDDLYLVGEVSRCLVLLLKKRSLITREELTLDWRPLYDLYKRYTKQKRQTIKLFYPPIFLDFDLIELIQRSSTYFSVESTQQMLDEWRPMLCLYLSAAALREAKYYMTLFLPTTLPPEHHDKGFKLWLDEVMHILLDCGPSFGMDTGIVCLLNRLSYDCIGYIDWEPYVAKIFTHFRSCFKSDELSRGSCNNQPAILWIVYMLGGGNSSCQRHISMFFKTMESFYHPSNTNWLRDYQLLKFLYELPAYFVRRVNRERCKKHAWIGTIPESHKLTDNDITAFVQSVLPILLTSMFNQSSVIYAASAFKNLAILRPELVIPPLLERLYGSYETLTEPNRFLSSINCMTAVIPALVKPCKYYPDGQNHVIPLLLNSLPGIDANDMRKTRAVFEFISKMASYIELKDYSYLVEDRPELTPEQQQLCLATNQFENFVLQFLDKCFVLIEKSSASSAILSHLEEENLAEDSEESNIKSAIYSVTKSVLSQASEQIQEAALDKLYSYVSRHVFDSKTQGEPISSLCSAFVRCIPEQTLAKFVPHFSRLILALTELDDVHDEPLVGDDLLFSLLIMSKIVDCESKYLTEYKDLLMKVLTRVLALSTYEAYNEACGILESLLKALTNISCNSCKNCNKSKSDDNSKDEEWPFSNWGATTHLNDLKLDWHIPGPDARTFAIELLDTFLKNSLDNLQSWASGSKELKNREDVRKYLLIIACCSSFTASVLPPMESEKVNISRHEVPLERFFIINTGAEPLLLPGGVNVRNLVVEAMKTVLQHVLTVIEDDTECLRLISNIFDSSLSSFSCITNYSCVNSEYSSDNMLLGPNRHLNSVLVERVLSRHRAMLSCRGSPHFTQLHLDILEIMFKLSTGHYVEIRTSAQDLIIYMMENSEDIAETFVVPKMVAALRQPEILHNTFKGILYLFGDNFTRNSIAFDLSWSALKEIWPALVESPHSEKPSIIDSIDDISSMVEEEFYTKPLRCHFDEKVKDLAGKMWSLLDTSQYRPFNEDETLIVQRKVLERNQTSTNDYIQLVIRLVNLVENPTLHWHRKVVAFNLLSLLARDDIKTPLEALNLFLANLIHERVSFRKKSVELVVAQLKLHKRKHVKRAIDPSILSSNDNSWLQYKLTDEFYTKEQWESLVFIDKPHVGFSCWPKQLQVYDDYSKQPPLENWLYDDMNQFERAIYDKFTDEQFIEKLVEYFTFEENKGADKFDMKRFMLFEGLFRNYGLKMIEPFKKYVEEYAISTCNRKEYKQRFVIEFLAGLIRGAKHWNYEMQLKMRQFAKPILEVVPLTPENEADWRCFVGQVFPFRDVRRMEWLLYFFMKKATDESEILHVTPYILSSRLSLACTVLCSCEWRTTDNIFHQIMDRLSANVNLLAYEKVRIQLAHIFALILSYDDNPNILSSMSNTLKGGPKVKHFIDRVLPQLAILERSNELSVTSTPDQNVDSNIPMSIDDQIISSNNDQTESIQQLDDTTNTADSLMNLSTGLGSPDESQQRKDAKRLLHLTNVWVANYSYRTLTPVAPEIFQLLPVLCDGAGDNTDPKLANQCKTVIKCIGTMTVQAESINEALSNIRKIICHHSWHARLSVTSYLRLMVSSNLFVLMDNPQWLPKISDIVINFLLCDERVEVREATLATLSGFIHCNFIRIDHEFIQEFKRRAGTQLIRIERHGSGTFDANSIAMRHSGILGLCACVQAHPYSVPEFLPELLIFLSEHLMDPQPISTSIKKTISDFRRTHHDNWQSDKTKFTEDQLAILDNLLVSPSYYA